jgi:hypothetical protein
LIALINAMLILASARSSCGNARAGRRLANRREVEASRRKWPARAAVRAQVGRENRL